MNKKEAKGCFIIAEAGVNHNGSIDLALELVECAAKAGADAVKFQSFKAEHLVSKGAKRVQYQWDVSGKTDQYSMLKSLELSEDMHVKIKKRCNELKIEFMSTPFDEKSADFLVALGVARIKISSGDLTNLPFLEYLATKGLPLLLSTGMSTLSEIKLAVNVIINVQKLLGLPLINPLTLLHCTSSYPTSLQDVNLKAMKTLASEFKVPIGYSDHTTDPYTPLLALALDAVVIEKHFTTNRRLLGPDHGMSLEFNELKLMIDKMRIMEGALGTGIKEPTQSELEARTLVRRSIATCEAIPKGSIISKDKLVMLRPAIGIAPCDMHRVVDGRAKRDLGAGEILQWKDISLL